MYVLLRHLIVSFIFMTLTIQKDDELPSHHRGLETDEVENITRSTLGLVPSIDDDGQKIICRAENPWVKRSFVEDSWILHVVCKIYFFYS